MALTDGDREWLQGNFDRIHDRINETNDAAAEAKLDTVEKIASALREHREDYHNPVKTWTVLGAMMAVLAGLVELVKWLIKKGP